VLFWAARAGQFDDLEGDAHRILMDEDLKPEEKATPSEDAADARAGDKSESA
jgi:nitrogen fixation-related uncharacterized protein